MKELRWKFRWAFLWSSLLIGIIISIHKITNWFVFHFSFGEGLHQALNSLPPIGCVVLTAYIVKRMKSLTLVESFQFLGFKKPNWNQITVGLIFLILITLARLLFIKSLLNQGITISLMQNWLPYCFWIFAIAGIYEEGIYRGFIFQSLRQGRTFKSAAALSGVLWSIYHLAQLGYSFDAIDIKPLMWQMTLAFLLAFPSAYLFERGGNVIWGWMLVHLGWDSIAILYFGDTSIYEFDASKYLKWTNLNIVGALVLGITAFVIFIPLTNWLLPVKRNFKTRSQ